MIRLPLLIVSISLVSACGGPEQPDPVTNSEEYTLDSCETQIGADVPAFFAKYFRCVNISMDGDSVVIESKGLPPHKSFYYASASANHTAYVSQGQGYYQNPNKVAEQNIRMVVPLVPQSRGLTINDALVDGQVGSSFDEYGMGAMGVALDSVALFNPLAAPGDDIEAEKFSFDPYGGHPEMRGAYHYHTTTAGPLEVLAAAGLTSSTVPGEASVEVYGIMCDGTVVLGCTELDGSVPDAVGLDAQNGHVHDMVDEEGTPHFEGRYHTHICPGTLTAHGFTPEIMFYEDCSI